MPRLVYLLLAMVLGCRSCFSAKATTNYYRQLLNPKKMDKDCSYVKVSEQEVTDEYFSKFGLWQRPRTNASEAVEVNMTLTLSSVDDVFENREVVRLSGQIDLRWYDELHSWNNTFPLNCVTYLIVPVRGIWMPEILLTNSPTQRQTMFEASSTEKLRFHSNGLALFTKGGTFDVFCSFDFTIFPFDTQQCKIRLESLYSRDKVRIIVNEQFDLSTGQMFQNEIWKLEFHEEDDELETVSSLIDALEFDQVICSFILKRKSGHYILAIILPISIISIAPIAVFSLPLHDSAKTGILSVSLLAYSIIAVLVSGELPRPADRGVPILSVALSLQMFYIFLALCGECLVFAALQQGDGAYCRSISHVPSTLFQVVRKIGSGLRLSSFLLEEIDAVTDSLKISPVRTNQVDIAVKESNFRENCSAVRPLRESTYRYIDDDDTDSHCGKAAGGNSLPIRRPSWDSRNSSNQQPFPFPSSIQQCEGITDSLTRRLARKKRWLFVGLVIDRITAWIYLFLTVTTAISMVIAGYCYSYFFSTNVSMDPDQPSKYQ